MTETLAPARFPATALEFGGPHFNGWMFLSSPLAVETMARTGFNSVTLDAQHGFSTFGTIVEGVAAAALAGKPALVRLPLGGFDLGARALDVGAAGVIAPMIDTVEHARAFVDAVKYPPVGRRSWGPVRAMGMTGLNAADYLAQANGLTLALAMIETETALKNADAILEVDGVDGVLIGPNDLSVSLSGGQAVDPGLPAVVSALGKVLEAGRRAGKPVAVFANNPAFASDYLRRGFPMICLGPDVGFLAAGAERALADIFDAPAIGASAGG